jgi:membrane associated rhomboid family serine protease
MSITVIILIVTIGISLLADSKPELKEKMLFNAYQIKHNKEWYRWITHAFIHGGFMHLALNMFVLYNFGEYVEHSLNGYFGGSGPYYYILLYFGGIIVSSMAAFKKHQDNRNYNSLGASGAVASVLFSFIIFEPTQSLYLFFIPIGIPAFIVGVLYLWYEQYMGKKGGTGIAHDAHFWGATYGALLTIVLGPDLLSNFFHQISLWGQSFL